MFTFAFICIICHNNQLFQGVNIRRLQRGAEPPIAMRILGHADYQTTANIYTHLKSEMMKKSSVDMEDVFRRKQEAKGVLAKAQTTRDKRSRKPILDMSLPWAGKL